MGVDREHFDVAAWLEDPHVVEERAGPFLVAEKGCNGARDDGVEVVVWERCC